MMLAHDISKGDRTNDVKITQNITFETMLLAPNTMEGLKHSGFYKPSPIQLYGIPIGKCGFDLLLEAKSGTGKTAVFAIIALEKLDFSKGLQVVILTPTREIAAQIYDVLKQIGRKYKELRVEVVIGGLPTQDDIEKFKKPVHIVVGSPGRLKNLIQNKHIDVKSVRLLVLDEADKLMDNCFQSDIKFIHTSLPKQKQVIMSSATYPQSSWDLINSYVQNANHVCPDSDCILLGIEQRVSLVKYNVNIVKHTQDRFKELHKILGRFQFKQCLIFCNYQVRVTEVHNLLRKAEWPSQKLYGQQEQVDRLDALKTLQNYKCRILVSTDLAARGIDASNVDLVVNFEPPYDWQTYLHRIGRAGRFGSYGLAITILSEGKELQKFKQMFKSIQLSINMRHLWSDEEFDISNSAPSTHISPPDVSNLTSDNSTSTNIIDEVSCKDMWDLLSDKTNAMNSIETFESEYKLSENLEIPKIEEFSKLMLSLEDENCQDSDELVVFKHFEMRKISTNQSMSRNSVQQNSTVIDDLKESNDEKINVLNDTIPDTFKNTNDNIEDTRIIINKPDEKDDTSKTMLHLDLPITFSSSKFKTLAPKRNTNKKISENNIYNSYVYKNKEISSKLQESAEIPSIKDDINTGSNCYSVGQIYHRNRINVHNHYGDTNTKYEKEYEYKKPQKKNDSRSHNITDKNYGQKESANLYSNWYNELKMRMKLIEHALYIDEMSRF